jgi:hypothetical protein
MLRRHALVLALAASACMKSAPSGATVYDFDDASSITNVQEAQVDEGGIIKTHGDHLVVLRRGRLFTIDLGQGRLQPRSFIEVPRRPNHDAWYDEMLIYGDTIVVVGYSYRFRSTEIGLFRIDEHAELSHLDTWFLDSNDYYSSRNYASRLIGDKLVFYMPHHVSSESPDADELPGVKQWHPGMRRKGDWNRIVRTSDIVPSVDGDSRTLHTLVTCDLGEPSLGCRARGILGGWARSFYVSGSAVYVWTHGDVDERTGSTRGGLYRMPLDEGPIGGLRVKAAPLDQFSFKETDDGRLHVMLQVDNGGDGMFAPEVYATRGDIGLVTLPLSSFARFGDEVPDSAYRDLPDADGPPHVLVDRFVSDDVLLYGTGSGWYQAKKGTTGEVHAVHVDDEWPAQSVPVAHGIDRLEPLGTAGLAVGSDGEALHFTSLALENGPRVAGHFVQPGATQGELRSHGFFFKPTSVAGGMLGLPLRTAAEPGLAHLFQGSASVLYLRVDDLQFRRLGLLEADPRVDPHDACIASCMDWYGNARPVFYKGRVFALLGYELVEGRIQHGEMSEIRRVDMLSLLRRRTVRLPG